MCLHNHNSHPAQLANFIHDRVFDIFASVFDTYMYMPVVRIRANYTAELFRIFAISYSRYSVLPTVVDIVSSIDRQFYVGKSYSVLSGRSLESAGLFLGIL